MGYAHRIDANQGEIVEGLRQLGMPVKIVSMYPGMLDLIIGYQGHLVWVEIKSRPKAKLTKSEKEVFELFDGYNVVLCYGLDDLLGKLTDGSLW